MGWIDEVFRDDPDPIVARDRMIEHVTDDPAFEAYRKQVRRGFIEPRLEFPTVSSSDDVIGERLGIALRLLVSGNEDDPRGVLTKTETRVLLAANILRAIPFLWSNLELELTSASVPRTEINRGLLPYEMMWWTYQDSPRLVSPGEPDIMLDGRLVQREGDSVTWFDVGTRNERFFIQPGGIRFGQVYPGDNGVRTAPPMVAALSHLRRPGVLIRSEEPSIEGIEAADENVVRIVASMGSTAPTAPQ